MKKIALIGAGQLGSRHLQGLAKSSMEISIEVVEPFEGSRGVAKERFEAMPENKNVTHIAFFETLSQLSSHLDLVIVATNSDVRYKVIEELLTHKSVANLVLEKVLFQNVDEYNKTTELLKKSNTKCWVNHPRRMFPFYQELKNILSNAHMMHFSISGGNWGMGCNGLHLLDCMEYLTGKTVTSIDAQLLDTKLYETKRSGFQEFNGLLSGRLGEHTFSMSSLPEHISPLQFSITSDSVNIFIDETNGWMRILKKDNNWNVETISEKIIYFQSEMTHRVLEDIFTTQCLLPTYEEAMTLHVKFLTALINHMNSFSKEKYDFCPIT
ncbi:MAG: Gfo/Idh/MocA family oxidoreductase [Campylobacterales bacterium]|nr:Gfo/Idh/MocA family oxidoreductase [Campylobacterales bacterium]MBN2832936.1 Gfo/Idh/MocA family oxidoreductase [Campylobacterales bacterium]